MARTAKADTPLTPLERQVLRWTADGKRSEEAAQILRITPGAVNAHMNRIMNQLGTNTRAGTVAFALRKGIIK